MATVPVPYFYRTLGRANTRSLGLSGCQPTAAGNKLAGGFSNRPVIGLGTRWQTGALSPRR